MKALSSLCCLCAALVVLVVLQAYHTYRLQEQVKTHQNALSDVYNELEAIHAEQQR